MLNTDPYAKYHDWSACPIDVVIVVRGRAVVGTTSVVGAGEGGRAGGVAEGAAMTRDLEGPVVAGVVGRGVGGGGFVVRGRA
jgi:acetyl-CoA carboxylase alpha subunit